MLLLLLSNFGSKSKRRVLYRLCSVVVLIQESGIPLVYKGPKCVENSFRDLGKAFIIGI